MKDKDSIIIKTLNQKFGTNLGEADKLLIRRLGVAFLSNEELKLKAKLMSGETFRKKFEEFLPQIIEEQISQNDEFFAKLINNSDLYKEILFPEIHKLLRAQKLS